MEYELLVKRMIKMEKTLEKIHSLLQMQKTVLNVDDLAEYTGIKKSYIYKLVSQSKIPYSKPNGGVLFFEKAKIDKWLLSKNEEVVPEKESNNNYSVKDVIKKYPLKDIKELLKEGYSNEEAHLILEQRANNR